jgi:hypothetical protein
MTSLATILTQAESDVLHKLEDAEGELALTDDERQVLLGLLIKLVDEAQSAEFSRFLDAALTKQ